MIAWAPPIPGLPFAPLSPFAGLGGSLGKAAATAVLDGFSSWLATGAKALVKLVASILSGTALRLDAKWFAKELQAMVGIAAVVLAPLLFAASIGAVIRQDLRRLARIWGVALPAAVIVGMAAIPLTGEAIHVTDAMSKLVSRGLQPHLAASINRIGRGVAATGNPFLATIVALVVIAGALLLWLELVLRSAAIYVVVFFLPLALAGLVWPATAHWTKRMVELLVALILSKFVIVAALSLAVSAVGKAHQAGQVIAGGAVLLMAGFAPFVLLRLAPMVEAAVIGHLEGVSRRPVDAARTMASKAAAAPQHPAIALLAAGHASGQAQRASVGESAVSMRDTRLNGGELDRDEAARARSSPAGVASPSGGERSAGQRADGESSRSSSYPKAIPSLTAGAGAGLLPDGDDGGVGEGER